MRVLVLGGTRFIGRAIVDELLSTGHDVTVVHRGENEPAGLPDVPHIHLDRAVWSEQPEALRTVGAGAVVDCLAMTRDDARATLRALGDAGRIVVLSSQDVYRAFESLNAGCSTDAVPLDEASPLSVNRYTHRGRDAAFHDYSKQDVEDEMRPQGAVMLRLPAVYGEHDRQRREEFILRRVRAARPRIPIGPGGFVWTRGYVRDIARGVRLAVEHPTLHGDVFNLGEERSWPMRVYAERILEAAGSDAELVTVPDAMLPEDMGLTAGSLPQPVLTSSARARAVLGYTDSDPVEALRASVRWHLANPPLDNGDFTADDRALTAPPTVPAE